MSKYMKKPVVIDAIQWDGSWGGKAAIERAFPELNTTHISGHLPSNTIRQWCIGTLEGYHQVSAGDFVIRGVKGEFYPCKPDIFALTYDKVNDE